MFIASIYDYPYQNERVCSSHFVYVHSKPPPTFYLNYWHENWTDIYQRVSRIYIFNAYKVTKFHIKGICSWNGNSILLKNVTSIVKNSKCVWKHRIKGWRWIRNDDYGSFETAKNFSYEILTILNSSQMFNNKMFKVQVVNKCKST